MSWQDYFTRDEIIARIRRYAGKGYSVSETAAMLGFDITTGNVAGLARRAVPPVKFGQPAPPQRLNFLIVDEGDGTSIHDDDIRPGDKRCRYPLWGDAPLSKFQLRYCGAPVVPGTSWCPKCTKVVFVHD